MHTSFPLLRSVVGCGRGLAGPRQRVTSRAGAMHSSDYIHSTTLRCMHSAPLRTPPGSVRGTNMFSPPTPTVICPLTPLALLNLVLTSQTGNSPTTLVICSARDVFLQLLLESVKLEAKAEHDGPDLQQLITPTLHNLSTARHVQVVFCASVQTLLAYLTAYAGASQGRGRGRLVVVNPLRLHAPTPSFSAQGLARTFAAAVEAASRVDEALLVVDCFAAREASQRGEDEEADVEREAESPRDEPQEDPWEQHVSVLNVSARRFGSGNADRAWAGRTVTAKRIAARWFRFRNIDDFKEPAFPD
jgi:hypothetical protein